jgi:outer membrane protein assembly factor BamB
MKALSTILALVAATSMAARASEPVINYRNDGTGAYPEADPPLEWSVTKNVRWRWDAPLFGTAISSPIIVGDRVITVARPMRLVCLDKHTGKLLWMRDRYLGGADGELISRMHAAILKDHRLYELNCRLGRGGGSSWGNNVRGYTGIFRGRRGRRHDLPAEDRAFYEKRVAMFEAVLADGEANQPAYEAERKAILEEAAQSEEGFFGAKGYQAACTPASDGKRLVAVFKPGFVVCTDLEGKLLWTQAVVDEHGRAAHYRWSTLAEVPQIADGKVLVTCGEMTRCFEAETGRLLWADDSGSRIDAASAVIGRTGGRHYVVLPFGEVRDLDDGRVVYERPVYAPGSLLGSDLYAQMAISRDRRTFSNVSVALRLTADPDRPVRRLWTLDELWALDKAEKKDRSVDRRGVVKSSHHEYGSPIIHNGRLYYFDTGERNFSVIDLETGKVLKVLTRDIGGNYGQWSYSDPILAGDCFFYPIGCTHGRYDGRTLVFRLGPDLTYQEVAFNRLEQQTACDPVFEGRRMYMRTNYALFCIEKPVPAK